MLKIWRIVRELIAPHVQRAAGEVASLLLDPCARLVAWKIIRRRTASGLVRRFASKRITKLTARCQEIGRGHCNVDNLVAAIMLDPIEDELMRRGLL